MTSPEEIDKALQFASENHFNHVFVQVRGRGDAFYDSRLVPKADQILDREFDPLQYAIRRGHELGLKVHAWMNVYFVWASDGLPGNRSHILNRYPEWADMSSVNTGTDRHFISPGHPRVIKHLLKVFEEVISDYEIDGLHLDYVRYSDADYGYNSAVRKGFESKYGVDPVALLQGGSQNGPDDETYNLWQQWNQYRRDSVTELVRKCNALILRLRSDCLLSAAVKPEPNLAKQRYFQEWDRWLVEGLVDFVVPMNYATQLREFARNIDLIYESIPTKYWSGIIMGIAVYNQNALDARDKVKYTKITGFPGIAIFSYDSHKDNPAFFRPIIKEISLAN